MQRSVKFTHSGHSHLVGNFVAGDTYRGDAEACRHFVEDAQCALYDDTATRAAEAERQAAEKAEAERQAAEKAEAERQAAEKAEAERQAAEKAATRRKPAGA